MRSEASKERSDPSCGDTRHELHDTLLAVAARDITDVPEDTAAAAVRPASLSDPLDIVRWLKRCDQLFVTQCDPLDLIRWLERCIAC